MSGPINTLPAGFLDLLGLKTGGVNPPVALDEVRPAMEMRDFYLAQRKAIYTGNIGNFNVNVEGFEFLPITNTSPEQLAVGGQLFVPPTEVWWLEWMETWILFDTVASQVGTIVPAFRVSSRVITPPTLGHGATSSSAAVGNARSQQIAKEIFVMPGTEIGAVVAQGIVVAAGSVVLTSRLMLARFKI